MKRITEAFALDISKRFCVENGYSYEKLIALELNRGFHMAYFAKYPTGSPTSSDKICLDSKDSMPMVPFYIFNTGEIKVNEKHLHLIK